MEMNQEMLCIIVIGRRERTRIRNNAYRGKCPKAALRGRLDDVLFMIKSKPVCDSLDCTQALCMYTRACDHYYETQQTVPSR
jgi:hypothetical protein